MGDHEVTLDHAGACCERFGCWNTFIVTLGRGRPKRYCSEDCRRQADVERKRCVARIELLEKQLTRERHILAAMGGLAEDATLEGDTSKPSCEHSWTFANTPGVKVCRHCGECREVTLVKRYTGPYGVATQLEVNPALAGAETTVCWWLLEGPWHPVWSQFILSVVSLPACDEEAEL